MPSQELPSRTNIRIFAYPADDDKFATIELGERNSAGSDSLSDISLDATSRQNRINHRATDARQPSLSCGEHMHFAGITAGIAYKKIGLVLGTLITLRGVASNVCAANQRREIDRYQQEHVQQASHLFSKEAQSYISRAENSLNEQNEALETYNAFVEAPVEKLTAYATEQHIKNNENRQADNQRLLNLKNASLATIAKLLGDNSVIVSHANATKDIIADMPEQHEAYMADIEAGTATLTADARQAYREKADEAMAFKAKYEEMKVEYEALIDKMANLKESIQSRIKSMCSNMRNQASKGRVRANILSGPVEVCDAIDKTLNDIRRLRAAERSFGQSPENTLDRFEKTVELLTELRNTGPVKIERIHTKDETLTKEDKLQLSNLIKDDFQAIADLLTQIKAVLDPTHRQRYLQSAHHPDPDVQNVEANLLRQEQTIAAHSAASQTYVDTQSEMAIATIDQGIIQTIDQSNALATAFQQEAQQYPANPNILNQTQGFHKLNAILSDLKQEMLQEKQADPEARQAVIDDTLNQLEHDLNSLITTLFTDMNEAWEKDLNAFIKELKSKKSTPVKIIDAMIASCFVYLGLCILNNLRKGRATAAQEYSYNNIYMLPGADLPKSLKNCICVERLDETYTVRIFDRDNNFTEYTDLPKSCIEMLNASADRINLLDSQEKSVLIESVISSLGHLHTDLEDKDTLLTILKDQGQQIGDFLLTPFNQKLPKDVKVGWYHARGAIGKQASPPISAGSTKKKMARSLACAFLANAIKPTGFTPLLTLLAVKSMTNTDPLGSMATENNTHTQQALDKLAETFHAAGIDSKALVHNATETLKQQQFDPTVFRARAENEITLESTHDPELEQVQTHLMRDNELDNFIDLASGVSFVNDHNHTSISEERLNAIGLNMTVDGLREKFDPYVLFDEAYKAESEEALNKAREAASHDNADLTNSILFWLGNIAAGMLIASAEFRPIEKADAKDLVIPTKWYAKLFGQMKSDVLNPAADAFVSAYRARINLFGEDFTTVQQKSNKSSTKEKSKELDIEMAPKIGLVELKKNQNHPLAICGGLELTLGSPDDDTPLTESDSSQTKTEQSRMIFQQMLK